MSQTPRYHHGDLRATLLEEATALLKEQGIEGLSLRRLAERAGVSRTAPYHHFKDKNALLCALATQAFSQMDQLLGQVQLDGSDTEQLLRNTVRAYLRFATANPELYELMFGRILWKSGQASVELKAIAYASFRNYADKVNSLFNAPGLSADTDPLRLAQASWATLHGLSRLIIDGIYVDLGDMEAVSDQAVKLMLTALAKPRLDETI